MARRVRRGAWWRRHARLRRRHRRKLARGARAHLRRARISRHRVGSRARRRRRARHLERGLQGGRPGHSHRRRDSNRQIRLQGDGRGRDGGKVVSSLRTPGNFMKSKAKKPLSSDLLRNIHAYWRAANYLSVGQIYLYDNPLLRKPLTLAHIKPRLLGHWGTTPGLNFVYVHLNRVIREHDLNVMYLTGPGHGGPGLVANAYLEGTYSEVYPNVSQDERGMKRLFTQFSFPGGIPSHVSPETPGSIHEGGELGYSLSHAFGAAFDNPDLLVACVVGDGEAETGPLATSWHSNKFLNPVRDGAVLPILHLNGYKIAGPTVLARITRDELQHLLRGYGWEPFFVEGHDPAVMHALMATTLDRVTHQILDIHKQARGADTPSRPRWPMIVLATPKGWTGPRFVDGQRIEGTFRSHQVPLSDPQNNPAHLEMLEQWMKSYRPE